MAASLVPDGLQLWLCSLLCVRPISIWKSKSDAAYFQPAKSFPIFLANFLDIN